MVFPNFNFDFILIKEHLDNITSNKEKIIYLKFIKKELARIIYSYTITELRDNDSFGYDVDETIRSIRKIYKRESCPELNEIAEDVISKMKMVTTNSDAFPLFLQICGLFEFMTFEIDNELQRFKNCLFQIDGELAFWDYQKELQEEPDSKNLMGRVLEISPEKILWKGSKQDLVAFYDVLIQFGFITLTKNKDQLLGKHFALIDISSKEIKEVGTLKHTRKLIKENYAKPSDKMQIIINAIESSFR